MSHDRGCHCGKEYYEYEDCTDPTCTNRKPKTNWKADAMSYQRKYNEEVNKRLKVESILYNFNELLKGFKCE